MLVSQLKTLSPALAAQWDLDIAQCVTHADIAARGPDMGATWRQVFQRGEAALPADVDEDLYNGFVSRGDRGTLEALRKAGGARIPAMRPAFEDDRLATLLFRYRARNFPDTLHEQEAQAWEDHRAARLFDGHGGARTIEQLFSEIDALSETADERAEAILGALYDYAESIAPSRY
jgi:exodeoxyribonuclease-1